MVRNRLKEIRLKMLIEHQTDMALLLSISQQQYNRYERQIIQPTLETALRIAQKLNKPLEEIFYLED